MELTTSAFFQNYRVDYFTVDNKRTLRPSKLVDFLQSISVKHSDVVGYDLDFFKRENLGWLLSHWHIQIHRWPKEGEELLLSTWSDQYRRIQANRDFAIEDDQGNEIVYASSRWVLVDTNLRRPIRPANGFMAPYKFSNCRPLAKERYSMKKYPNREPDVIMETTVTRRDTDTNNHTNNAVYIDWACDTLDEALYETMTLTDIMVSYEKECRLGDKVTIETWQEGGTTFSRFRNSDEPSCIYGRIIMQWIPMA